MIEYSYEWSDFIGNIGVVLLIGTFGLLQFSKIDSKGFWYSFNNMMVAILLSINLYYKPNLSSIIIEIFWFGLSVYGIVQYYKNKDVKS
ncbi:hypothetical protein N9C44_00570 [bacterium]|jgi:hypothetical protein|nr:hypothetical protein [bacterium]|tara:strand:+ start:587 stop:853 length:267 start_codon:yes stop_codon:yes gene_type:complete